jgi:hypothetical protein
MGTIVKATWKGGARTGQSGRLGKFEHRGQRQASGTMAEATWKEGSWLNEGKVECGGNGD